jgi:hypothetical protein
MWQQKIQVYATMVKVTLRGQRQKTKNKPKQEGHDGPEVAHLYIGSPNPHSKVAGPI